MAHVSTPYTPGSGGFAAVDRIDNVDLPRIKIALGAAGTAADAVGGAGNVSAAVQRMTLAADDPAVTALASILAKIIASPATEATLSALNAKTPASPATAGGQSAIVDAVALVVAALAGTLTVSGTVTANTNLNQPLTDTQLRASDVPVSANALPLPTGAATQTTLSEVLTEIQATLVGLSVFRSLDLDETHEQAKASAGKLWKLRIANFATSPRYVKIYNHASPTVGTTTPIDTIVIPAAESGDACIVTETFGGRGLAFSTALSFAAVTGLADSSDGAPGANEVVLSAYFE